MNYLIYGNENILINNFINNKINEYNISNICISRYDAAIDPIQTTIEDSQTISLFDGKKLIILDNCDFFNKGKDLNGVEKLLNYLEHSNPNTILIFINRTTSIDSNKKITKQIKEFGHIIKLEHENINQILLDLCKNYKITNKEINILIKRVGNDIDILSMELEKIKTYTINKKVISEQDIIDCTSQNIDLDIFKFIDNIINKNKSEALKQYYELLNINEEPIKIIALLASKFRLMYQVKRLNNKYDEKAMANIIGVKEYPVKLALKACLKYDEIVLIKYLKALANLDYDIKTGNIEPKLGLELFILKI